MSEFMRVDNNTARILIMDAIGQMFRTSEGTCFGQYVIYDEDTVKDFISNFNEYKKWMIQEVFQNIEDIVVQEISEKIETVGSTTYYSLEIIGEIQGDEIHVIEDFISVTVNKLRDGMVIVEIA